MHVGTPPTPTPPEPPRPQPPPPPPVQPLDEVNQDKETKEAAGSVPEATTPRSNGLTLPNETPQLQPPPGGNVNSGKPSIDVRA
jgi:hypothetical protein